MSLERFSAPVADEADLTWAIIQVGRLAKEIGFKESGKSMVMTAASELGRNILKYARRGTLVAEPVDSQISGKASRSLSKIMVPASRMWSWPCRTHIVLEEH